MPDPVRGLKGVHLFHVLACSHTFQLSYPVINGLTVLLFNRREIRLWTRGASLKYTREMESGRCLFATLAYTWSMGLSERISTLRRANELSARQLAALVDVAPTTVTRIEAGVVSPSFDLAQEILAVLGEPIGFTGLADRDAIVTARLALDPRLGITTSNGVLVWRERWARIGLVDSSGVAMPGQRASLLTHAATAARLTRRTGAVDFLPAGSAFDVAAAMRAAGVEYAMTGDSAANLYSPSAGEVWPVLYVSDVPAAAEAARLTPRASGTYGGRITLIPFDGVCELGRIEIEGTTVAALDQVILDCYGGTGRMAEQAELLLGRRAA